MSPTEPMGDADNDLLEMMQAGYFAVTPRSDSKECSAHNLRRALIQIGRAACYRDLCPPFTRGSLRNCINRNPTKFIRLPQTNPAFYILPEWYEQYKEAFVTGRPIGVYVSYNGEIRSYRKEAASIMPVLLALPSPQLAYIHDINLYCRCDDFDFVDSAWSWNECAQSYRHRFVYEKGRSYNICAYPTASKVTVAVGCSRRAFLYGIDGLARLTSMLGEVRGRIPVLPDPMTWMVSSWHYNKDVHYPLHGLNFEVCYKTLSGCLGRIYYKHNLGVIRLEEIQTPKLQLAQLHEKVVHEASRRELPKPAFLLGQELDKFDRCELD